MASEEYDLPRRRHATAQERQQILARYLKTQLSQRDFALREGIGFSTLCNWLRQERGKPQPAVSFQEVAFPSLPAARPNWALEVVSPRGWKIRMAQIGDAGSLQQIMRALPC